MLPGSAVSPTGKLPLPLPDYLDRPEVTSVDIQSLKQAIDGLLKTGLADAEDVSNRISAAHDQSPRMTARLTQKQRVYDDYFGVARHKGGNSITLGAMVPVLAGLATELQSGSSLTEGDVGRLMDGLTALLETLSDSLSLTVEDSTLLAVEDSTSLAAEGSSSLTVDDSLSGDIA